jgi:hypothetical protein
MDLVDRWHELSGKVLRRLSADVTTSGNET